ncbi:hypothetical protein BX600DRAFT_519276 [Xylariales sp. PMI_506]|nr:hypothetical protein BX600DRAFT_519276 [Xylariales sp. PMI_506]
MSTPITINVINQSGDLQAFQIFNDPPQPTGETGPIFMNTWGTAPEVNSQTQGGEDGVATFTITENYYAICGNAPSPLAKALEISTKNTGVARLTSTTQEGSNWKVEIPAGTGNAPIFDPAGDTGNSKVPGGFTINTQNESWVPSEYPDRFCGIARQSPLPTGGSEVVPTAVWAPKPNQTYDITPTRIYYISYGQALEGLQTSVVDLGTPATIDFTGTSFTTASVTLKDDYSWSIPSYN